MFPSVAKLLPTNCIQQNVVYIKQAGFYRYLDGNQAIRVQQFKALAKK